MEKIPDTKDDKKPIINSGLIPTKLSFLISRIPAANIIGIAIKKEILAAEYLE
jgi:hypothetical protein